MCHYESFVETSLLSFNGTFVKQTNAALSSWCNIKFCWVCTQAHARTSVCVCVSASVCTCVSVLVCVVVSVQWCVTVCGEERRRKRFRLWKIWSNSRHRERVKLQCDIQRKSDCCCEQNRTQLRQEQSCITCQGSQWHTVYTSLTR